MLPFKRKKQRAIETALQDSGACVQKSDNNFTKVDTDDKVAIEERDTAIEEFLKKNNANTTDVPEVDNVSVDKIVADMQRADHNALNKVLLEILSPQLTENEIQKRSFKQRLMNYILKILSWQLAFVAIPIVGVFVVSCYGFFLENANVIQFTSIVFNFLKYYITAIIVEFIAMLFFIVKYVFDKSIVDLMDGMLNKKRNTKRGKRKDLE